MMPKKVHSHKRSVKPVSRKKRGIAFIVSRLTLFFGVALLFFVGTKTFIKPQNTQSVCANSKSCTSDLTEHIDNNVAGVFEGKIVAPPQIDETALSDAPVLGANTEPGDKHIFVDLSTQTLYAFQGAKQVFKTLVASGKWGRTPVGNFHIWEKLKATRMAGGEGADAYDLPNVPWVMYFFHDFGLHGAYWHDNFGHVMSHGCVNMRQVDAKTLFEWADGPDGSKLGTPVSICNRFDNGQCVQDNPVQ